MIRDSRPEDAAAIAAIWNPVIQNSAITFWPHPRSEDEIRALIAARQSDGHGHFVVEQDGAVLGFASYGQFRAGPGYARAMEHTLYLAEAARGAGLGAALMAHLEAHARLRGARIMVGAITGDNAGSLRFHTRLGYAERGRIPAAGWKFGQFHTLVLMVKDLDA